MKKIISVLLVLLLAAAALTACTHTEYTAVHIVHDGQLWEVPEETTGIGGLDESRMTDATIISRETMPSREGEINVGAASVRIYDDEDFFLVIIDGKQHLIQR